MFVFEGLVVCLFVCACLAVCCSGQSDCEQLGADVLKTWQRCGTACVHCRCMCQWVLVLLVYVHRTIEQHVYTFCNVSFDSFVCFSRRLRRSIDVFC